MLVKILYIYYLIQFKKDINNINALLDLQNKIKAIILAYASKLSFRICRTDMGAKKIDGSIFAMFEIFVASFQLKD